MRKQLTGLKLFASVKVAGTAPSPEQAEALLTRADDEIELRVRTPFTTAADLEGYAISLARAIGRVLVAVRTADWHKPRVILDNPHGFFGFKAVQWRRKQEQQRAANPRIQIRDAAIFQILNAVEKQIALRKYGTPLQRPIAGERKLLPLEEVLWVAREMAGVSEITLLPASGASSTPYPITATLATPQGMEAIRRGIALLGDGKTPLAAVREITWNTPSADARTTRSRNPQRIEAHRSMWAQVCAQRGYGDPLAPIHFCVCREQPPPPRDFREVVEQWVARLHDERPHQAVCYERLIDILTYASDWALAESYRVYEVGERHSMIGYYNRKLAKARAQNPE